MNRQEHECVHEWTREKLEGFKYPITPPKFLKRFNCIRCGKKLTKEEHEIDTGNLCEDCRKVTINEDAH